MSVASSQPLRIAIYARQSVEEEQGIAQQVADCRAECARLGHLVADEYLDDATSATKRRGPKTSWTRMLRDFDGGRFDAILVTEASRLARDLPELIVELRVNRSVRVLVILGSIDTDDPTGAFILNQMVNTAEFEIALKKRRAARYAAERRKFGHPTSGKTPHGYRWVPSIHRDERGTRYEVDENEAPDIRRIYHEYLAGASLGQIARDLNDAGRRTRAGARWQASTVRRVLMNPLYAALLPPVQPTGGHRLAAIDLDACSAGAWEPIVEKEQLLVTHARLSRVKPVHDGTARRWLLSGIAVCGVCRLPVKSARGETHPTERKDGSGTAARRRYHTYRCSGKPSHFMRNGEVIDELVEELCIQRLSRPDVADLIARPGDEIDIAALHTRRAALETHLKNVFTLVGSQPSRLAAAQDQIEQLEDQMRIVDVELARAVHQHPLADLMGVQDVRSWWSERTLARKRAIVEMIMSVAIKPVGYGRRPRSPEEVLASLDIAPLR